MIKNANAAGTVVDYGDSTNKQYQANVALIQGMDLTDAEKQAAFNTLHQLTESQLKAEAKATGPYSMGVGPARYNKQKTAANATNAVQAKAKVDAFMKQLQADQKKKAKKQAANDLTSAMMQALSSGALSFTFNGKTYTRKTKRSQTFTAN